MIVKIKLMGIRFVHLLLTYVYPRRQFLISPFSSNETMPIANQNYRFQIFCSFVRTHTGQGKFCEKIGMIYDCLS